MMDADEATVADLPPTHFSVAEPWILVRDGRNLPKPNQPILFIRDIRGTREEEQQSMFVRIGNQWEGEHGYRSPQVDVREDGKVAKHEVLISQMFQMPDGMPPEQEVLFGFVDEVGQLEETGDWWISVKARPVWRNNIGNSIIGNPDHVTYWMPLPLPPVDTFKRSPYPWYAIYNIVTGRSPVFKSDYLPNEESNGTSD